MKEARLRSLIQRPPADSIGETKKSCSMTDHSAPLEACTFNRFIQIRHSPPIFHREFSPTREATDTRAPLSRIVFKQFSKDVLAAMAVVVVVVVSCRAYRRHVHSLNGPRLIRKPYSIPRSVSIGEFKQVPSPGHVFESTCTIGQPLKSEEGKKRGKERKREETVNSSKWREIR